MKITFVFFLCVYIAGQTIRFIYELLKKAGRLNPRNKILFVLIFADMIIMWLSWFVMCPLDPVRVALPAVVRAIGLGAFILGFFASVGGMIQLRGVENIDHLVTTGLFAKFRHPMYHGFILWIVGWVLYHGAVVSALAGLLGIANILYWRCLEENQMEIAYGEAYREYRRMTWF